MKRLTIAQKILKAMAVDCSRYEQDAYSELHGALYEYLLYKTCEVNGVYKDQYNWHREYKGLLFNNFGKKIERQGKGTWSKAVIIDKVLEEIVNELPALAINIVKYLNKGYNIQVSKTVAKEDCSEFFATTEAVLDIAGIH